MGTGDEVLEALRLEPAQDRAPGEAAVPSDEN
jgi:hypothetical protein